MDPRVTSSSAISTGAGLDTIGCQRVSTNHLRLLSRSPQPKLWVALVPLARGNEVHLVTQATVCQPPNFSSSRISRNRLGETIWTFWYLCSASSS